MSDEDCILCSAEIPHDMWGRRRGYPAPHPYTQAMQDEFDAGKRFERDTVRRLLELAPDSEALRSRGIAPYEQAQPEMPTREQIAEACQEWMDSPMLEPLELADAVLALLHPSAAKP